jgi:hypothetical protein
MGIDDLYVAPLLTFMAECFWPGVTAEKVTDVGERIRGAACAIGPRARSGRYIGSILVPADEIAFCLFEAPSKATALQLDKQAGIPSERVLQIVHLPANNERTDVRGAR